MDAVTQLAYTTAHNPGKRPAPDRNHGNTTTARQHSPGIHRQQRGSLPHSLSFTHAKSKMDNDSNHTTQSSLISGQNTLIAGGIFQQTVIVNHNFRFNQYESLGLYLLSQSITAGAIHDSAERYPPPRCTDGDHTDIRQTIISWSNDPLSSGNTLWVSGTPDKGPSRSAIAQTVAETLAESDQLAGSFFFEKNKLGRGDSIHVFLTLAYQIAMNIPGMRERINAAIYHDPTVLTKAAGIQLRTLIIKPFNDLASTGLSQHPSSTIVIDALDECEAQFSQQDVLKYILTEASRSLYIPIRFIIFSERKPEIQQMFQGFDTYHSVRCMSLDQGASAKIVPLRAFRLLQVPLTVRPIPYGHARSGLENAVLLSPPTDDAVSGRPRSCTAPSYTFVSSPPLPLQNPEKTPPSVHGSVRSQWSMMDCSSTATSSHSRMDTSPPHSLALSTSDRMDCSPAFLPLLTYPSTNFAVDGAPMLTHPTQPYVHDRHNELSPPVILYPSDQTCGHEHGDEQAQTLEEANEEEVRDTTKVSLLKTLRSQIGRPRSRSWGFQSSSRS